MKTVIHIGTYKTGTSTIQSFCRQNGDFLVKHGLFFPAPDSETLRNQHAHVIEDCVEGRYEKIQQYIRVSHEKASALGCDTVILSSEGFSSLNRSHIEKLIEVIDGDVEVIVYFRNVYKYIISTIGQLLKEPSKNLVSGRMAKQLQARLDYDKVVTSWDVSGIRKMHVFSFDKVSKSLVRNFFESVSGKPFMDEKSVKMENKNVSVGMTSMLFLTLNGIIKKHDDHERLHKKYFTPYKLVGSRTTVNELRLARMIYDVMHQEITHPLLREIADELTYYNEADFLEEQPVEFLDAWIACLSSLKKEKS